ncbi:hypothetical protein VIGAN_10071400 [Vigna angularis var. angularis]|nr:hypothetical protein VIGAN_10071400 [Vigna angularis var. angularis]
MAVNEMFGKRLSVEDLVVASLKSEEKVSGYHADDVTPSIMGRFVLIQSYEPLQLIELKFPTKKELYFVLVSPKFEAPTKKMHTTHPGEIGMAHHVWNCSQVGALVATVLKGDMVGLGKAWSSNKIVEPRRGPLIPGMRLLRRLPFRLGPLAIPLVALASTPLSSLMMSPPDMPLPKHMIHAFLSHDNLKVSTKVLQLDRLGARRILD